VIHYNQAKIPKDGFMTELSAMASNLQDVVIRYGTQIVAAVIILLIGITIAKALRSVLDSFMQRRKVDDTVRVFLTRLCYLGILIFIFIATLAKLGVDTTSIIAILGAASLAVGLALRNSLSDFAAGILLIILRPFRVGDLIDIGVQGTVIDVNFLYTEIKTTDGKCVMVPNGKVMGNNLINFSTYKNRRTEINVNINYSDNLDQAKALLFSVLSQEPRVLPEPAPVVAVQKLSDTSVSLLIRFGAQGSDIDPTTWALNEAIKKKLTEAGFNLPANPQQIIVNNPKG
jgi:small conductance mechanosensitive channel